MSGIVGYRIVPPEESRALDATIDPIERLLCHVTTNHIARPKHANRGIERAAIDTQRSIIAGLCPQLGIVRRANNKRRHVTFRFHKLLGQTIQQFYLSVRISALAFNIIKEDGKRAHTVSIHKIKLMHEVLIIFFVPFNILSRMHSPNEVYPILMAGLNQFLNLLLLLHGIRLSPIRSTMIRIIFRAIDIGVKFILAIPINQRQTHSVRPRRPIKALHDTTIRKDRRVTNIEARKLLSTLHSRTLHQLSQSLDAIEES